MKAGWFQQAKSVFGRPEPVPQPFAARCDCGATISGERTDAVQKPNCPACGQTVFVLPACAYPIPESLRRRWSGLADPIAPPTPAKKKGSKKAAIPGDVQVPKAKLKPPVVPWSQRRQAALEAARRQVTPLRLIVLGVCVSVWLTAVVLYRQARFSRAQATVQTEIDAGTAALADRKFSEAAMAWSRASASLAILNRRDETAARIHRLAREANVAAGLADDGLPDLLSDLVSGSSATNSAARFARRHAGQWIVFDAPLFRVPDDDEERSVQLDLPLLVGDQLVEVKLDGQPWSALLSGSTAAEPHRVLFAAQLDRFEPATKARPAATVWLRGSTAVLWTEHDTLAALDLWPADAEQATVVEQLLQTQRALLETQP